MTHGANANERHLFSIEAFSLWIFRFLRQANSARHCTFRSRELCAIQKKWLSPSNQISSHYNCQELGEVALTFRFHALASANFHCHSSRIRCSLMLSIHAGVALELHLLFEQALTPLRSLMTSLFPCRNSVLVSAWPPPIPCNPSWNCPVILKAPNSGLMPLLHLFSDFHGTHKKRAFKEIRCDLSPISHSYRRLGRGLDHAWSYSKIVL